MSNEISRVEVFVEDKNLGKLLRGIAGLAVRAPDIRPVVNAELQSGKLVATARNGELVGLFANWIHERKLQEVRAADCRDFLRSIGKKESNATYLIKKALEYGVMVRKKGTSGSAMAYVPTSLAYTGEGKGKRKAKRKLPAYIAKRKKVR